MKKVNQINHLEEYMNIKELVQHSAAEDVIKVETDTWIILSKRE